MVAVIRIPHALLWHYRLGHMHHREMQILSCMLPTPLPTDLDACPGCFLGPCRAFLAYGDRVRHAPLDLVHVAVYGPMPTQSLGGASHFVTFVDHATHRVWAFPLVRVEDAAVMLDRFMDSAGSRPRCLQMDYESSRISLPAFSPIVSSMAFTSYAHGIMGLLMACA